MKHLTEKMSKNFKQSGDTIVEVLIAITIAAFAIGISYSTAQRSLQQAIAAREHNQALDILENQVADLNYRFQKDSDYNGNFASKSNFCLGDNANPGDSGWRMDQASVTSNSPPATPPYNTGCQTINGGANYFANISTSGGVGNTNPTVYTITVRWYRLGGGINKATLFYKLNNSPSATLSAATSTGLSKSGCTEAGNVYHVSEDDKAQPPRYMLQNSTGYRAMEASWNAPWSLDSNCSYTIEIDTAIKLASQPNQPNQQMFVELCNDISSTACSLTGNSASYLFRSPLTSDIADNLTPPLLTQ